MVSHARATRTALVGKTVKTKQMKKTSLRVQKHDVAATTSEGNEAVLKLKTNSVTSDTPEECPALSGRPPKVVVD